jgi:hypothetical protein
MHAVRVELGKTSINSKINYYHPRKQIYNSSNIISIKENIRGVNFQMVESFIHMQINSMCAGAGNETKIKCYMGCSIRTEAHLHMSHRSS